MKIQLVNYSGCYESDKININKLSSPESFDDYDLNVIDLSDEMIWTYDRTTTDSINDMDDIEIISKMLKKTKNNMLFILPQNIYYKYNYEYISTGLYDYSEKVKLNKNLNVINTIINKLLGWSNNAWLMYDKTTSTIAEKNIVSDFIFQWGKKENIVSYSSNGKSVTSIKIENIYFTTLNLRNEETLLDYINYIKLFAKEDEMVPGWMMEIKRFDDVDLEKRKESILFDIDKLNKELKDITSKQKENDFYKSILYKSGDELVNIVNIMLGDMINYNYAEFVDKKEEDFLFESENLVLIGEIKGITPNIKRSYISQTAIHRDRYLEIPGNENKNVKAIAIINRQRNLPINQRDDISQDIINIAKTYDVLVVTAETFLSLYENFKSGKINKDYILDVLSQNKGLLKEEVEILNNYR